MATAAEVAAWMQDEFARAGQLTRAAAVAGIRARFGPEFAPGGRLRRDILAAFQQLAPEGRVWSHQAQAWRRRNAYDAPGRGRVE
jgi:hypothetical protein